MIRDHDASRPIGGMLLGACAGMSERSGLPALLLRILAVAALLCVSFKLTVVAYCVAALWLHIRRS